MISPTPMDQLNRVWKHEAGHQGGWYVSTKVVSLKHSSQRGLPSLRRMYAGNHAEHGCDLLTWLRPHTCLQTISHKSIVAFKKNKALFSLPPPPMTTVNIGPLTLNNSRQVTLALEGEHHQRFLSEKFQV